MSLIVPGLLATGIWCAGSYVYSLKQARDAPAPPEEFDPEPFQGAMAHIKQWAGSDAVRRGLFRSVREDIDIDGSQVWLVDYGNGSLVKQWIDPRILQ